MKIYLDDERQVPDGFVGCRNAKEFFDTVIKNIGKIEQIMFDHDLGVVQLGDLSAEMEGDYLNGVWRKGTVIEKSGYFCAKRFIDTYTLLRLDMPILTCHSVNPLGRERIKALIEETNAKYNKNSSY